MLSYQQVIAEPIVMGSRANCVAQTCIDVLQLFSVHSLALVRVRIQAGVHSVGFLPTLLFSLYMIESYTTSSHLLKQTRAVHCFPTTLLHFRLSKNGNHSHH